MKNALRNFVKIENYHIIECVGAVIFMVCSAVFLPKAEFKALILALCAYIFIAFIQCRHFRWSKIFSFKDFFRCAVPVVVVVVIVFALQNILKKDFVETVAQIATGVLIAIIVFEFTYHVRKYDDTGMDFIRFVNIPDASKVICKLSMILCRILVVLGIVLTILKGEGYTGISAAGCVLWGFYRLFTKYCWYMYYEEGDTSHASSSNSNSVNNTDNVDVIGEHKVESLVRKIADRWDGKEDFSLPGQGLDQTKSFSRGYIR